MNLSEGVFYDNTTYSNNGILSLITKRNNENKRLCSRPKEGHSSVVNLFHEIDTNDDGIVMTNV